MGVLGTLATRRQHRYSQHEMKALGTLAVAERDILARTPAPRRTRENRARSGDYGFARERASPFQSARRNLVSQAVSTSNVR